jgi:hypothetical protein
MRQQFGVKKKTMITHQKEIKEGNSEVKSVISDVTFQAGQYATGKTDRISSASELW